MSTPAWLGDDSAKGAREYFLWIIANMTDDEYARYCAIGHCSHEIANAVCSRLITIN